MAPVNNSPVRPRSAARSFPKASPTIAPPPTPFDKPFTPSRTTYPLPHAMVPSPTPPYSSSEEALSYLATRPGMSRQAQLHKHNMPPPPPPGYSLHPGSSVRPASSPCSPISSPLQFGLYPQPYPSNPYYPHQLGMSHHPTPQQTAMNWDVYPHEDMVNVLSTVNAEAELEVDYTDYESMIVGSANGGMSDDPDSQRFTSDPTASPDKAQRKRPPRPCNAWILYRSDKLNWIKRGDPIPNIDEILEIIKADEKIKTFKASSGQSESAEGDSAFDAGHGTPKSKPKKKGKKNAESSETIPSHGPTKSVKDFPQATISKIISALWKRESSAVKDAWQKRSEQRKTEHEEMYPGYKFAPIRKEDKAKMQKEREIQKQLHRLHKQKEKSTGRSHRGRVRTRLSPNAPYSVMSSDEQRSMARSLSLSSTHSGAESSTADLQAYRGAHANMPSFGSASECFPEDDHQHKSYPFPMPYGSLPSIRPDEHAASFNDAFYFPPTDPAVPPQPVPLSHSGSESKKRFLLRAQGPSYQSSPEISSQEFSREQVPSGTPAEQVTQTVTPTNPRTTQSSNNTHTKPAAKSAAVGSNQHTGDEVGIAENVKGSDNGSPSSALERRASGLAAMWCLIDDGDAEQEDDVREETAPLDKGKTTMTLSGPLLAGESAAETSESKFHGQSMVEGSSTTSSSNVSFTNVELKSLGQAYAPTPSGWVPVIVPMNEDGSQNMAATGPSQAYIYHPASWPCVYATDGRGQAFASDKHFAFASSELEHTEPMAFEMGYLDQDFDFGFNPDDQRDIPLQAVVEEESGPFLSDGAPLLSPTDGDWTLRNSQSNSSHETGVAPRPQEGMPYSFTPRHFSTSAYLPTPQSLASNLPVWNDRSMSYAFAGAMQAPVEFDVGEDMMGWDESVKVGSSVQHPARRSSRVQVPGIDAQSKAPASTKGIATPVSVGR